MASGITDYTQNIVWPATCMYESSWHPIVTAVVTDVQ